MEVGLDSSRSLLSPVGTKLNVYQDAKEWLGGEPDFIIRSLGTGGGAATALGKDEVGAAETDGVPIFGYYNDSVLNGGDVAGSYALGMQDAAFAIAQADKVGLNKSYAIACDVEVSNNRNPPRQVQVTSDWVLGFADGMAHGKRLGMLYGSFAPSSLLLASVRNALQKDANGTVKELYLWVASWVYHGLNLTNARKVPWLTLPSDIAPMVKVWQISGAIFGNIVDQNLALKLPIMQTKGNAGFPDPVHPAIVQAKTDALKDVLAQASKLLAQASNMV